MDKGRKYSVTMCGWARTGIVMGEPKEQEANLGQGDWNLIVKGCFFLFCFFSKFIYLFIYFLALSSLRCCARAFL